MKRRYANLILCGLVGYGFSQQVPPSKYEMMKRVQGYVGTWEVQGKLLAPPELANLEFRGTLEVKPTLNGTALEFRAKGKAAGENTRTMDVTGIVGFNDATSYDKWSYMANFFWSEDARFVSLKGNFKGKELVLDGKPVGGEDLPLRIRVDGDKDKVIHVFATDAKREDPILDIKLIYKT